MPSDGPVVKETRSASCRGSAAAEFVLVSAILFTVIFGVLEFGLMMNAKMLVTNAAREAARKAAVDGGSSAAAVARGRECLRLGVIDPDTIEVSITPASAAYGSTITVRVACQYEPVTPVVRGITRGPVPLASQVVTRSEKVK